jgi:hypothetical protein
MSNIFPKPSAGLLIHSRNAEGRTVVLCGRRRKDEKLACLSKMQIRLQDCWSIPFGQLDAQDAGDFRACAVREAAEEVLHGTAYAHIRPKAKGFDQWVGGGFALAAVVAASNEWRGSPVSQLFDSRAYAVRLSNTPADAPSLDGGGEFAANENGLKWRELAWLESQPDKFFGMDRLLRFFAQELAAS